jgi:hypothetical protein
VEVKKINFYFKSEAGLGIVKYRPIARQRLNKQVPVGSNANINRTSIGRQRISKHA